MRGGGTPGAERQGDDEVLTFVVGEVQLVSCGWSPDGRSVVTAAGGAGGGGSSGGGGGGDGDAAPVPLVAVDPVAESRPGPSMASQPTQPPSSQQRFDIFLWCYPSPAPETGSVAGSGASSFFNKPDSWPSISGMDKLKAAADMFRGASRPNCHPSVSGVDGAVALDLGSKAATAGSCGDGGLQSMDCSVDWDVLLQDDNAEEVEDTDTSPDPPQREGKQATLIGGSDGGSLTPSGGPTLPISHEKRASSPSSPPGGGSGAESLFPADLSPGMWTVPNPAARLAGHTGSVLFSIFSPDGSGLASGSQDGTIKVWEPRRELWYGSHLDGHIVYLCEDILNYQDCNSCAHSVSLRGISQVWRVRGSACSWSLALTLSPRNEELKAAAATAPAAERTKSQVSVSDTPRS